MHNLIKARHATAKQSGFTLIEVLVTISIMAIGMLGISAMQSIALLSGQGAIDRGEAALFATSMAERMRANTAGVNDGDYAFAERDTDNPIGVSGTANSPERVAKNDINDWLTNINQTWGNGVLDSKAQISCLAPAATPGNPAPAIRTCTIRISWDLKSSKTRLQREHDPNSERYNFSSTVIF